MKKKYYWIIGILILLVGFLILLNSWSLPNQQRSLNITPTLNETCEENKQFFEEALNQSNYTKCLNINDTASCEPIDWPTRDPYYISMGNNTAKTYISKDFCLSEVYYKNFENCKSLNNTILSGNYEILSEEAFSCPGSHKTYGCGGIYYEVLDSKNNCLFYVDKNKANLLDEKTIVIDGGKLQLTNQLGFATFYGGGILVLTD